jgi:hypothetical protein
LRVQVSPLCLLLRIRGGRGGSAAYPSSPRRYGPAGRCAYRATSATCRWPSVTACVSAAQVGALSCSQARIGARPLPRPHGNAVDHRTLREPERHRRDLSRAASQRDVLAPDSECGCWTRPHTSPHTALNATHAAHSPAHRRWWARHAGRFSAALRVRLLLVGGWGTAAAAAGAPLGRGSLGVRRPAPGRRPITPVPLGGRDRPQRLSAP